MVTLYIDADSCPKNLRTIILRAAAKHNLTAFFVADRPLRDVQQAYEEHTAALRKQAKSDGVVDSLELRSFQSNIKNIVVEKGPDSADNWIAENAENPAIAITHDIPLASRLVEKGIDVLDERGTTFTQNNMSERLSIRNAMTEFREMGVFTEKHASMGPKQVKAFSDAFNTLLFTFLKQ